MEFLALILWLTLASLTLALLPAAFTAPAGVVAMMAAGAGFVVCVLWIVLGAPSWTGWAQLGLAIVGSIFAGLAVAPLTDARSITGTAVEEVAAGALGLVLPFYVTTIAVTLLMATGATDPVV